MKKFYIYKWRKPVAIIENADKMLIEDINTLSRALKLLFNRDIHLKPIHPGDFDFDPVSGRRILSKDELERTRVAEELEKLIDSLKHG